MSDSYHHGDLRRALLDASADALAEGGVGALSLRDLARRVGVSATAPYHHFANKGALVEALVADTFAALDRASADASADAAAGVEAPAARVRALGVAYISFALDHPERFRLAFRPELGSPFDHLDAGAVPVDAPVFRHLVAAVSDLGLDDDARVPTALAAWSLVHGFASLVVDGPLRALAADRDRARGLAEAVTQQLSLGDEAARTPR